VVAASVAPLLALFHITTMNNFPPPYVMCFEDECRERQEQNQVSVWEATPDTCHLLITKRLLHPQLAVAKYRRSAAGDSRRRPPRTLPQLLMTWKHLLKIFVHQQIHSNVKRQSLCSAVAFVDDRVRAIQVDLVLSQESCASLQIQLIRYQIVCCYLLSQVPRTEYEPKFARQALWTALTAYWNDDGQYDDEVLCYNALCQLATCLIHQEGTTSGGWQDLSFTSSYGNILLLAQHCDPTKHYPKFQFALDLVSCSMLGFYRNVLVMLDSYNTTTISNDNFWMLCKLCMAPAFNMIRLNALRHYNKAFGKLEKISGNEVCGCR